MRKIIKAGVLVLAMAIALPMAMLLSGCSSSGSGNSTVTEADLVGTWNLTGIQLPGHPWATEGDAMFIASTLILDAEEDELTFSRTGMNAGTGTWSVDGQYLVTVHNQVTIREHATLTGSNNRLYLVRTGPVTHEGVTVTMSQTLRFQRYA